MEIVNGLRTAFPDTAVTTDIMVGFPGETDEEFQKTAEFIKKADFADAHVFMYSQRRGTPAAKRPDQIPPEVKEKRSKEIIEIVKHSRESFLSRFIGSTHEVLFEQPSGGYFEGKTSNYITVKVKANENLQGQYRDVLFERIENGCIIGKIV